MNILFDANDQITLAKSGAENLMSYQAPEILLEGV
jgi:serine/threonine protein kinase